MNPETRVSYPTPSGKLEFWTEEIEGKFRRMGLSSLPEFYSEAEQLIDLPHLQHLDQPVISPFFSTEVLAHPASIESTSVAISEQQAPESAYDTELVTGRPPAPHFHSWTHYFWQAQEMWPELFCQIHPDKAKLHGIDDGDSMVIETRQGSIQARAWLHRGIRPTSVFIPIGWDQQQPYHPGSTVNHLTGIALDPVSQQANLKTHLCRISKSKY
jgi:anaerobic selenocysteine-containing dehydrogenase